MPVATMPRSLPLSARHVLTLVREGKGVLATVATVGTDHERRLLLRDREWQRLVNPDGLEFDVSEDDLRLHRRGRNLIFWTGFRLIGTLPIAALEECLGEA